MKKIYLKNLKKYALIDDADYPLVSKYKWRGRIRLGREDIYVVHSGGNYYMHWLIMGTRGIDHINGNGLDNRRENLRVANTSQNGANRKPNQNKKYSRFKGVGKRLKLWTSRIMVMGEPIYLGTFKTQRLAAVAYDKKALELFGKYARFNFPQRVM